MSESLEVQLARLDERMHAMEKIWMHHTKQDMEHFVSLGDAISALDAKVETLVLDKASREGEIKVNKRNSAILAAIVSTVIAGIAQALGITIGG